MVGPPGYTTMLRSDFDKFATKLELEIGIFLHFA